MASSLECEVCLVEYNSKEKRPKSLPCGHTICSSCVTDNLKAREGKMDCPFCRTPCGTGVKTLDDFPTTFVLLNLLDKGEPNVLSKSLTPREKEKKSLQQKRQAESDRTGAHIANCNEHLRRLLEAKESQELAIQSFVLGKHKLLEDYQQELKRLEEGENKATSMKEELEDIVAEGNDIVKGLEALQDRVKSASSLPGLNMASQDVQRYYTASKEWVTSKVNSILEEDTYSTEEEIICSEIDVVVRHGVMCQRKFQDGELLYSCLQCRTNGSTVLCGSCFVNSAHLNHNVQIRKSLSGESCSCGKSDVWKRDPTCWKHQREDHSSLQVYDESLQASSKCTEVFFTGEKCYICSDCRTMEGVVICGSCFVNSPHRDHRYTIHTIGSNGAFCDCGNEEVWKVNSTCKIHI